MAARARLQPLGVPRETSKPLRITLPEPPSANRYWRHDRGETHVAKQALNYRGAVRLAFAQARGTLRIAFPLEDVRVSFVWYRGIRSGDLDNRIKQLCDSLQGVGFTSDKQVVEIHAIRRDDARKARLELVLEAI